ncbi:MAG TPA: FtsX-like permease family protein [Symbiobacteriaceae bacterium]|nr:FtsX-like permease family protein [Symbiobacteriaceae bacterium]
MRWKFWAGRRDRLALALIGVLVMAAGLSTMSLLSDSIKGTVTRAYEQTWRAPYDILVHMPLAGGTGLQDITEPNILTTLPAGISRSQWEAIRQTPGVQVAAPLAVVGYVRAGPSFLFPSADLPQPGPGIYRLTSKVVATDSPTPESLSEETVVVIPDPKTGQLPAGSPAGAMVLDGKTVSAQRISAPLPVLLVGMDPEAEDRLVGLQGSMTAGRYLAPEESLGQGTRYGAEKTPLPLVPVLINSSALQGLTYSVSVVELGADLTEKRIVYQKLLQGVEVPKAMKLGETAIYRVSGKGGPLRYEPVSSPFPDRWPTAVSLNPTATDVDRSFVTEGLKTEMVFGHQFREWQPAGQLFQYTTKGSFDSAGLNVVKDPQSQMPLMTYRPATALHVLDAAGRPINPPHRVAGGLTPVGFLSSPPMMLTTIPAALGLAGENAINAIQVKVHGAEHFTPETVDRVRQIAATIERQTGLVAEVTMGSSPMNVLVKVPADEGRAAYGWVEEQWIHKNASVTAVQQVEFGYSAYVVMVLVVGVLYALATGLAGVTARRRELGIAAAVGWPAVSLMGTAMAEQLAFAGVAGLMAGLAAGINGALPRTVIAVFVSALVIYLPAALAAGLAAARSNPGDALRWGDTAPGRRLLPGCGVLALAAASLSGRPARSVLTVVATAVPTALLLVLTFVSRHLSGTLFTTITGQYAALRVGTLQYAAGAVALAIAAVTGFDLIHQNAIDHRNERALLYALGWPRWRIGGTMVAEGGLLGTAAGLLGGLLGLVALVMLYGSAVASVWSVLPVVMAIPLALGLATGLVNSLTEVQRWNRAGLSGVGESQVARFGRGTRLAVATAVLATVAAVVWLVVPRLTERLAVQSSDPAAQAAANAAAAIEAVVAQQSRALERLDQQGFLATIDASDGLYLAEQQHWLEDAAVWGQAHPGETITRSAASIALLGSNTAHVRIQQRVGRTKPDVTVLETVWVLAADGHWREHGLQHEAFSDGGITVWYPEGLAPSVAQVTADHTRQAMALLEGAGWPASRPLTIELVGDEHALRAALGPNLGDREVAILWSEFGEPVRVYIRGNAPSVGLLTRALASRSIMEASHNHASEWWREGVTVFLMAKAGTGSFEKLLNVVGPGGVLPLERLPGSSPGYLLSGEQWQAVSDTSTLLAFYLEQRYGQEAVRAVLAQLAKQPPDQRMTGPATYAERDRKTVQAIEAVTGRSWTALSQEFRQWMTDQHTK